jgi:protein SCO1
MLRTAVACAAIALLLGSAASWLTRGFQIWTAEGARRLAVQESPVPAPAATLEGPGLTGHPLQALLATPGRVTLVNFIYTRCPGVCLALGSSFQQLQRQTGPSGVKLLSISFDPTHDDAAQLQRYANGWGADPARWQFATVPDRRELQTLLQAFQVTVVADGTGGYEHNAALLVVDAQGRLVRIFDDTDLEAALAYALSTQGRGAAL